MKMKKIVTHAGIFHADEMLAICIVNLAIGKKQVSEFVPIERTNFPTAEMLEDLSVCVLDVGKSYNRKFNNFDHHQNENLHASNVLVWNDFKWDICLSLELEIDNDVINWNEFSELVQVKFLQFVSDVDCGRTTKEMREGNIPTLNSIIRNMNNLEGGFEIALQVAFHSLMGAIETSIAYLKGKAKYKKFEDICKGVKLQKDTEIVLAWKDLAEEDGTMMLITPNRQGWQVITRDSELVLPQSNDALFRHASGFMIVFLTLEQATEYAKNVAHTLNF